MSFVENITKSFAPDKSPDLIAVLIVIAIIIILVNVAGGGSKK